MKIFRLVFAVLKTIIMELFPRNSKGYILPICGILSFFIVIYYWVQEFPIGICVDVMSGMLQTPGLEDVKEISQPDEEVLANIYLAELKKQFRCFYDTGWFSKFSYPFQTVLCIIDAALQGVFVIFALRILGASLAWTIFCVVAGLIGYIPNLYVVIVAIFYIMVILGGIVVSFHMLFCCWFLYMLVFILYRLHKLIRQLNH